LLDDLECLLFRTGERPSGAVISTAHVKKNLRMVLPRFTASPRKSPANLKHR
jgi:hypothetical protein